MKTKVSIWLIILMVCAPSVIFAQKQVPAIFKAGAGKIDITPAEDALPRNGFKRGIRDRLNVRAIVVDNAITTAAMVSVDVGGVPYYIHLRCVQQIEKKTGIPAGNIVISASHTHSSIQLPRENAENVDPNVSAFAANFEKSVVDVVTQAWKNRQPARIGYMTGTSYLNVNRDVIDPVTRLWTQAPNYDGPSDKEISVVTLETPAGEPIAVYYNFGMHPNSMYMSSIISADAPGVASSYIEDYYNGKVIALWSSSASGNQNPRYLQPMQDIERMKSEVALSSGRAKNTDEANRIAGFGGGVDDIFEVDPGLLARQSQMISSIGQFMGEEVLRVMKYTQRFKSEVRIFVADTVVTCPGRKRTDAGREGMPGTYIDADPVNIGLKLLVLGDIAFTIMGGDPYSEIAMRLKHESPFNYTVFVVHSNSMGGGYIPSDEAYGRNTFQVLSTNLQPGCAERAIINGFLDLMDEARK